MAGDAAWFNPVVLNPDALPALLHPLPMDHPTRVDYVGEEAPFAIHEEFLAGADRSFPRNISNLDVERSNPKYQIKDPLDPTTLLKPYPEAWLGSVPNKHLKPSRKLLTNRHVNPIDPIYQLPSGPCTLPAGTADFFSNRVTNQTYCGDIQGASPSPLYKRAMRDLTNQEIDYDPRTRPAKLIKQRMRCDYPGFLDTSDCNGGKRKKAWGRHPQTNPVEPIYGDNFYETSDMKHRRLKSRVLPPHKPKWNIAERVLDSMYFRAELLPDACRRHGGETIPFTGEVNYEGIRKSLETFGLKFNDVEFGRLLRVVDQEGRGKVRYRDLANSLRHCDGLELDVATELCNGLGVNWGHAKYDAQKPACLGQSCAVIIDEVKRGPSRTIWSDTQQMYDPITGLLLPYQKPAKMSTNNSFAYNLNEVIAARAIRDKDKDLYIPGAYLPRKSIPVTHSCAISKSCTLPHVFIEGTSPKDASAYQHDLYALGKGPVPAASGGNELEMPSLSNAPQFEKEPPPLKGAPLIATISQIRSPPQVTFLGDKPAILPPPQRLLEGMKGPSPEALKPWQESHKLPLLTGIHSLPLPVNSESGKEVTWRSVEPMRPRMPYVSYRTRTEAQHKAAEVNLVKSLLIP